MIDRAFDLSFRLMRVLPPLAVLAVFSVLTAVLSLLAVRWTSDQKAIRRVKNLMGAHLLEVRLTLRVGAFDELLRVVPGHDDRVDPLGDGQRDQIQPRAVFPVAELEIDEAEVGIARFKLLAGRRGVRRGS